MSIEKHNHDEKHHHHSDIGDKPWQAIRIEAVESLLHEIGVINSSDVDAIVHHYEEKVGPKTGARVVVNAGQIQAFKHRS